MGDSHTVLLRSDGNAVACGNNEDGQCDIPPLDAGMSYTQVSAGGDHTVLLRSDGSAIACGNNLFGQVDIPPLEQGICYTQVSAGMTHTVLLRSDGCAVACGNNIPGQCDIPPLNEGVVYTQVSAGGVFTVFLQSNGVAVASGFNEDIPSTEAGTCYVGDMPLARDFVVQLDFVHQDGAIKLTCSSPMTGEEVLHLNEGMSDLAWDTHKLLARELNVNLQNLKVVLPDGQLLASTCHATPKATMANVAR
jgi:hypothetical protein